MQGFFSDQVLAEEGCGGLKKIAYPLPFGKPTWQLNTKQIKSAVHSPAVQAHAVHGTAGQLHFRQKN